MTRRRAGIALAGVAALAAAIALVASRGGGAARGDRARGAAGKDAPARATPPAPHGERPAAAPAAPRHEHRPPPDGVRDPEWGDDAPAGLTTLEAYLVTSVYPPQSRPLGRFATDLLDPNRRHEDFEPSRDGAVTFRFTGDRHFVHADEPLVATLEVRRDDAPVAVTITQAFVAPYHPGVIPPEATRTPLPFVRHGTLHAAEVRAAALPDVRETRTLGVYVEFDHGGAAPEQAMFTVQVTPAAAIPARFTGEFRDRVHDGSLQVEVGIEVVHPGWFLVDCNLYDADDYPVAWTRFKGDLAVGRHWVPLSFFGKVLVDSQSTSPWHLGQLRGARFVEGREPDLDSMPIYEGRYETARYALTDFSDAAYDSPEKQDRIELLREGQRQGRM